jgi:hypothetical protein
MSEQDEEIERLKASVSCAVLLERLPPVWYGSSIVGKAPAAA